MQKIVLPVAGFTGPQVVETPADVTAPTVPTGLTATPAVGQIALSWTASTDDVGVVGYRVYRDDTLIASPSGTSFTDTGRSATTSHSYQAAAVDAADNISARTTAVTATSLPVATILTSDGFSGTNGNIPAGRVTDLEFGGSALTWTPQPTARLAISANQLTNGSVDGPGGIYLPVSAADVRLTVRIRAIDSTPEILTLDIRRQAATSTVDGTDNAWSVITGAGNAQLMKKVGGVWTKIGPVVAYAAEADLAIQALGSRISMLINGAVAHSVVDTAVPSGSYIGIAKTAAGNIRNPNWMRVDTLAAA
ncbi:minor tail protein [Gordonia phage Love]|uniref:Minor tail protein n=1 Tax=Gordonia phage Love TaxID=2762401 RepID=A0A7G8LKH7_9CAUD|nr:minor tail protein [Gordonia phage Love]QNJ57749.1 minor tail protein [Gordonia phage Love]